MVIVKFWIIFSIFCLQLCDCGQLWCHQGGAKRNWGPTQCPESTKECFKFDCLGGQSSFVARGCGVSVLPKGLRNESCFQAMEVCQYLGGESICHICNNKHMCNSTPSSHPSIVLSSLSSFILILTILYIHR